MADDQLAATLDEIWADLAYLRSCTGAIATTPEAFDLDGLMPRYASAVAALDAVLKLAGDWEAKSKKIGGQIALEDCNGATAGFKMIGYQNHRDHAAALREAITAELTKGVTP
jgi:hypothetical protein